VRDKLHCREGKSPDRQLRSQSLNLVSKDVGAVAGAKVVKSGSPQWLDITIIGKPTPAGIAFVKYTLSPTGLALYKKGGFTLATPVVTGDTSAIPAPIKSELGG